MEMLFIKNRTVPVFFAWAIGEDAAIDPEHRIILLIEPPPFVPTPFLLVAVYEVGKIRHPHLKAPTGFQYPEHL